ncbi:hypothetical protein MBLNU13_g08806t2 [Cladosporium sp. NU13]
MPHSNMLPTRDEHTIDTRTPSPRPPAQSGSDNAEYQPDLSQEVSLLSTKLINAINYQTNLDDSLQHTRHELEAANRENVRLRAEKKSLDDMVANGLLIRKSIVDKTIRELRAELAKERDLREEAERARKQTDAELESLTTALFEEANTMVAAARKDTEAVEKRNSQLRGQISDTELLLASQQEQLQDLKLTMGRMSERGDNDTSAGRDSVPSTPIGSSAAMFDAMQLSPNASNIADIPPEHPLYFSQLLTPVLRSDIPAYLDFQDLLISARKAMSHSRAPSAGNGSAGLTSTSQTNLASSNSPSLPGAFSFSTNSSPQSVNFVSTAPLLKDTKFYKRSLVEDIEPTLRLDLAPGLSFLSRRTVLSSLLQGSMVVEPFMPQTKFYGPIFACALCGEQRKAEPYVRKHRFRTSEEESAQRYPLCDYCLGRTRAAGDFVGFLRMVRDGHWRAESEEEQKGAWEEAVRLRERMFWARQGGGVIPSLVKQGTPSTSNLKSARPSLESIPEQESPARKASQAVQAVQAEPAQEPVQVTERELNPTEDEKKPGPDEKLLDVLKSHRQSMSLGGNLVQPPSETPVETVLPEVVEPQEMPSAVSGSENVEVHEPAIETAVVVPESEVQTQEPALADGEGITIHPQPAVKLEEPEAADEQIPVAVNESEPVQSVLPEEPEATETNTLPGATTSEQAASTTDAPIAPATANQEESAVTVDEEPAKDAPAPVEETSAEPVTVDEEPAKDEIISVKETLAEPTTADEKSAKDAPITIEETSAPPAVVDTPSSPVEAPSTPVETPSTLQAPGRPTERRGSSVLARVRAMESPKPPGSFD